MIGEDSALLQAEGEGSDLVHFTPTKILERAEESLLGG